MAAQWFHKIGSDPAEYFIQVDTKDEAEALTAKSKAVGLDTKVAERDVNTAEWEKCDPRVLNFRIGVNVVN